MRISGNYGTFLAPLMKVIAITSGDVLELGVGYFSTPYLHYQCLLAKRHLVSYDNDPVWIKRFTVSNFSNYHFSGPYHTFKYVKKWDQADIEKPWDVALVDHSPDYRRVEEITRLANFAKHIVIHDSNREFERNYHYSTIYPLFKYQLVWTGDNRHATILSNQVELKNFDL